MAVTPPTRSRSRDAGVLTAELDRAGRLNTWSRLTWPTPTTRTGFRTESTSGSTLLITRIEPSPPPLQWLVSNTTLAAARRPWCRSSNACGPSLRGQCLTHSRRDAGCPCQNIARTHRKPPAAILGNCRPSSSAASPDLPAQFLHLGHPNVFALDLPSPARIGPGSSNKRLRSRQARSILIRYAALFAAVDFQAMLSLF